MKNFAFTIIFLIFSSSLFAGAWTMKKNHIYSRLSFNYYYADKEFKYSHHKRHFKWDGKYKDKNIGLYVEYGLTDRITLLTSLYYKKIEKKDDYIKMTTSGVGDIDFGVKLNIFKGKKGVFSVQTLVKIPEAYDEDDALPLGNGQYDYELRAMMGLSLWPHIPGYVNMEFGYRWRTEAPSDELRYLFEFGTNFTKNLYARIKLDGIRGMNNGKKKYDFSGNPTLNYNYDLGKLYITAGYKLKNNYFIEFEVAPEIYGKNTSSGTTYTFAVGVSF